MFSIVSKNSAKHDNSDNNNINNTGVMYSRCDESTDCGKILVCDITTHRCKKDMGGSCSTDMDCNGDLTCVNWVCQKNSNDNVQTANDTIKLNDKVADEKKTYKNFKKHVNWNENVDVRHI
jgi:hypothetical protein